MSDETYTETITLTQVTLGLEPYTLIRLAEASDGSGEPVLRAEAGGGAEEDPLAMPLMLISDYPAGPANRVATMLREVYQAQETVAARKAVAAVVAEFNPDWLPFVRRAGS